MGCAEPASYTRPTLDAILDALNARLPRPSLDWLSAALKRADRELAQSFALAPRRVGRAPLLDGWTTDEAARAALLLSAAARLPAPRLGAVVEDLHRLGDARERAALRRCLPLLPGSFERVAALCAGPQYSPPAPRAGAIEPRACMSQRGPAEYEALARAGISAVVEPCAHRGWARLNAGSFEDDMLCLLNREPARAAAAGLRHYCALGLGPRDARDEGVVEGVLWLLPRLLDKEAVVAVGELGLEDGSRLEEDAYARQLELARAKGLPVIVRAPGLLDRALALARDCGLREDRVLVAGAAEHEAKGLLERGCWVLLELGRGLDARGLAALLRRLGPERLLVSGAADWSGGDALAVPAARETLLGRGIPAKVAARLVRGNPAQFYGLREDR